MSLSRADIDRLKGSVDWSIKQMDSARRKRMKLLRKMTGVHYAGEDGRSRERRPVNMIELGVDIFQRGLASHQPQAIVTSDFEELLPTASDFETVLNRRIRKMRLKDSLNICAVEA